MPRYIIKLKNKYLEYSSVVDAPVTRGMTLDEFKEYYKREYGERGFDGLEARLKRVESRGTSCLLDDSVENTISVNRAGPGETCITIEEMYKQYCEGDQS